MLAVKDVWLLGDNFLRTNFHAFPAMRDEAKQANNLQPYLFRYYNIKHFYSTTLTKNKNAFCRLTDTIEDALSSCERLPHFILMLLNKDLLETVCNTGSFTPPEEMEQGIEKALSWVTSFVERSMMNCKTDMFHHKPGSATAAEPKFIWVKMLPRKHQHLNKVEFFRYRYNVALENRQLHPGFK